MVCKAVIVHGGAPTAVLNASLYGVVRELVKSGEVSSVLGASGGVKGILTENFVNLSALDDEALGKLPFIPASAIGSSRDHLEPDDYAKIIETLSRHDVQWLFLTGGNGTMDTAGKIFRIAGPGGLRVIGIPKTIDNDIAGTDHTPGYGSAARYIAAVAAEVELDLQALPIHICVIEAMGRNTGWITAASALGEGVAGSGPDIICPPELPFDEESFLDRAQTIYREKGYALVVAAEGLKRLNGEPLVDPIFTAGRSVYYGDTGAHLANLIVKKLGIKARSEKPGILGRVSSAYQSETDRAEAIAAGAEAAKAALAGKSGIMVGFEREEGEAYRCRMTFVPLEQITALEKKMPAEFFTHSGNGVTEAFRQWCLPLIGSKLACLSGFQIPQILRR
jgi:6-phosphofructokinase 1